MPKKPNAPEKENADDDRGEQPRIVDAKELFRGKREIWLELNGVCYRLRITRRNKMVLQK